MDTREPIPGAIPEEVVKPKPQPDKSLISKAENVAVPKLEPTQKNTRTILESIAGIKQKIRQLAEKNSASHQLKEMEKGQISFQEKDLQNCLGRLKVYKDQDDALKPWLYDDTVEFLAIPRTEKTAEAILVFKHTREKEFTKKTLLAYAVVDTKSGRAVNMLDLLPPEENWRVVFDPTGAPQTREDERIITISELPQMVYGNQIDAAVPLIMVAGHEIGHAVKAEEESYSNLKLLKGLSLKELVPAMLVGFSYGLPVPSWLRSTQGNIKFNKNKAEIERKASTIGLLIIRRMRQLGVDPLPGMTNNDIMVPFDQALKTKDNSFTKGKVYSHK